MKQPLVPIAILYAFGILAGRWLEAPLVSAFTAAFAVTVLAKLWSRARICLLALSIFLFGWLNFTGSTAIVSPVDVRTILSDRSELAMVRGKLRETPSLRVVVREERETWRSLAELDLAEIKIGRGEWQPVHGRIITSTDGTLDSSFVRRQTVSVTGVVRPPPSPIAEGLFNYRAHLAVRGIYYELKVERPDDWSLAAPRAREPIATWFQRWAKKALAAGLPEEDEALRLQWAMVLGWKTALTGEVAEPFMRSGTMHIFAISGLHIALIAGIVVMVLRAAAMPRLWCGGVVLPLIWFYTAATGWQASAVRSAVMTSVIVIGWSLQRPSDLVNSLAAAALLILIWDPRQLFQASFQLSFFVVLSIALLVPALNKIKAKWFKLDLFLPMEVRPRWQRWGLRAGNAVWTGLAISLAAFIGSAPLTAHYFHLFTPGSLLANVLIVPVSSLALMSGLASLTIGPVLPFAAEVFNHSGWFWMRVMIWLSDVAASAPGAWFYVPPPGILVFALYYGVVFAALTGFLFRRKTGWWIAAAAALLAGAVVMNHLNERKWAALTVLPLNGGHAVYCRADDRWLMDCGDESAVTFVLKPFLQNQGVNRIRNILLTHGDSAQNGGTLELQVDFPVQNVFTSPLAFRSTNYREALSHLDAVATLRRTVTNGAHLAGWHVLHPTADEQFSAADDAAIVLRREINGVRILLLSDLGRTGQERLFSRHTDLRADIVVAGLPERGEPLIAELLDAIQPGLIVIADSEFPATARASQALAARLRRAGIRALLTRDTGALTFRLRNGRWEISAAHPGGVLE